MSRLVKEGSVRLHVPDVDKPEQGRAEGFYNPAMAENRDISVACLAAFPGKVRKVCDALTATGVRAIRYKKEVGGDVWACDVNENAIKRAARNARLNKVKINLVAEDANAFLNENGFDFVDIDPYGSPIFFVQAAGRSLGRAGYLAVTATDTAQVAERRYGVRSVSCSYSKELGTRILVTAVMRLLMQQERILVTAVMRLLMQQDKAFQPLLCFQVRHYIRIFGAVVRRRSVKKCDSLLEQIKLIEAFDDSYAVSKCTDYKNRKTTGPVYLGPLQDKKFCRLVLKELTKRRLSGQKIVKLAGDELAEPFYYDTHFLSKKYKKPLVGLDKILGSLSKRHKASRTVFCPTAVKTDAGLKNVLAVMK